MSPYTLAEAARLLDVHENTIRYAEREGRVRKAPRDEFGSRMFNASQIAYLRTVLRPQPKRRRLHAAPTSSSCRASTDSTHTHGQGPSNNQAPNDTDPPVRLNP